MSNKPKVNHPSLAYLRVKIKSLAAEAKIIRAAEIKARDNGHSETRLGLHLHRVNDVRSEARSAQLARVLICGKRYSDSEAKCEISPDALRISVIASKYGARSYTRDDVRRWIDERAPTTTAAVAQDASSEETLSDRVAA